MSPRSPHRRRAQLLVGGVAVALQDAAITAEQRTCVVLPATARVAVDCGQPGDARAPGGVAGAGDPVGAAALAVDAPGQPGRGTGRRTGCSRRRAAAGGAAADAGSGGVPGDTATTGTGHLRPAAIQEARPHRDDGGADGGVSRDAARAQQSPGGGAGLPAGAGPAGGSSRRWRGSAAGWPRIRRVGNSRTSCQPWAGGGQMADRVRQARGALARTFVACLELASEGEIEASSRYRSSRSGSGGQPPILIDRRRRRLTIALTYYPSALMHLGPHGRSHGSGKIV